MNKKNIGLVVVVIFFSMVLSGCFGRSIRRGDVDTQALGVALQAMSQCGYRKDSRQAVEACLETIQSPCGDDALCVILFKEKKDNVLLRWDSLFSEDDGATQTRSAASRPALPPGQSLQPISGGFSVTRPVPPDPSGLVYTSLSALERVVGTDYEDCRTCRKVQYSSFGQPVIVRINGEPAPAVRNPYGQSRSDLVCADIDGNGTGEMVPVSPADAMVYIYGGPQAPPDVKILRLQADRTIRPPATQPALAGSCYSVRDETNHPSTAARSITIQ